MGKIISTLGWIVVAGGGVVGFVAMAAVAGLQGRRGGNPLGIILAGGPGLLVSIGGMLVVAAGQAISCFISIEKNTHATSEAQAAIYKSMTGRSLPGGVAKVGEDAQPEKPIAPAAPSPTSKVACPKCMISEDVCSLYDVTQYTKFEATNKSSFGFQSVSLTCKNCGTVFRV
jgi:hypothetical protein